jgi:hypothetical protein
MEALAGRLAGPSVCWQNGTNTSTTDGLRPWARPLHRPSVASPRTELEAHLCAHVRPTVSQLPRTTNAQQTLWPMSICESGQIAMESRCIDLADTEDLLDRGSKRHGGSRQSAQLALRDKIAELTARCCSRTRPRASLSFVPPTKPRDRHRIPVKEVGPMRCGAPAVRRCQLPVADAIYTEILYELALR